MIVMGIDASTTSTGWSIFDSNGAVRIASGRLKPKGDDWRERLQIEYGMLVEIIEQYRPERIYMEDVPLKDGKPTILKLGAIQGLLIGVCARYQIAIEFLLPSQWRSTIGLFDGTRQGTQREVLKHKAIDMANKLFGLDLLWVKEKSKLNEDDEAEALLIAYSQIKPRKFGRPQTSIKE